MSETTGHPGALFHSIRTENRPGRGNLVRRYYLHQRKDVFYAELVDQVTGRRLTARSTGKQSRDEAMLVVAEWLRSGIPTGRMRKPRPLEIAAEMEAILSAIRKADMEADDAIRIIGALKDRGLVVGNFVKAGPSSVLFLDFLAEAWDPERSGFIREKKAYGHPLTLRHIRESAGLVARYWDCPRFRGVLLVDVDRGMLKEHLFTLHEGGLAASTVNLALAAISAPLNWAARESIIPESPAKGIPRFSGEAKERGILAATEIEALAALEWPDPRARVAFLVALTCGLRLSEVVALRLEDIAPDRLLVRHSWSWADGLTGLKNKEARDVSVLPEVRGELLALAAANPHGLSGAGFVFFGVKPDRPIDAKILTDGYLNALAAIGIDEEKRKARNLVFHGLRHNYATALAERVDMAKAMKSTGHRSAAMFAHYSAHQTEEALAAVGAATADAFGKVVKFRKVASE